MKQTKREPSFLQTLTGFWLGNAAIFLLLWNSYILSEIVFKIEVIKYVSIALIAAHMILCFLYAPFEQEEDKK